MILSNFFLKQIQIWEIVSQPILHEITLNLYIMQSYAALENTWKKKKKKLKLVLKKSPHFQNKFLSNYF